MATITICSDFGAQKNKVWHCFHCFPIYVPWSDGAMIFVFWMLSFKPTFSLSSFTFIKRLFSSSSLSAIRVVSSAYLRYWYFSQQSWFQLVLTVVQNKILYPLNNLFQPTNSWQPQFFLFLWFLTVNGIIQLLSFCVLMFKLYPWACDRNSFIFFKVYFIF